MSSPEYTDAIRSISEGLDRREREIAEKDETIRGLEDSLLAAGLIVSGQDKRIAELTSENARLTAELGIFQQVVARHEKDVTL
jgi:uncharacterized small protein (DUF1192 family)